ncbi:MAG: hypothetical protein K8T26_13540 [Lentisphaerae bacterium]|nr:hypothetical protein [Lentisphaerota bacterium]
MVFHGSLAGQVPSAPTGTAATTARRAENKADLLELDVERLLLITEALWTLLQEQHGYTENDLIKRIAELDLRDGKLDGRFAAAQEPMACPHCARTLMGKRPVCLYCGKPVARDPFSR